MKNKNIEMEKKLKSPFYNSETGLYHFFFHF